MVESKAYRGAKGLWRFCVEKKRLVLLTCLAFLCAYAARLFFYNVGVDTELYLAEGGRERSWLWWIRLGRFGLSALQYAGNVFASFDIVAAHLLAGFFMLCAAVLWSRLLFIFSQGKIQDSVLTLFSVLFVTNPIWAEGFYFTLQTAETALAIALAPITVHLFFDGFTEKRRGKTVGGVLLLTFLISIYQAVLPLFCCGVFAAFLLFVFCAEAATECDDLAHKKMLRVLCLEIFIALVASVALYFIASEMIRTAFKLNSSNYLTKGILGEEENPSVNRLVYFCVEVYKMTVGKIPFLQKLFNPIMAARARTGWKAVRSINGASLFGSVALLPLFALALFFVVRKVKSGRRSALTVFATAGILVCAFFFPILAYSAAVRTYWAFPLAVSFLYVFCIFMSGENAKRKTRAVLFAAGVFTCLWQIKLTSQLFTSDLVRFRQTEEVCRDVWSRILETESGCTKPVVFVGVWERREQQAEKQYLISGEIVGRSVLEHEGSLKSMNTTKRAVAFMQAQGLPVFAPSDGDSEIIAHAFEFAESWMGGGMPSYPDKGCVQEIEGCIVVKLSALTHQTE